MANAATCRTRYPDLGFGLGLRTQHYQEILESTPPVDWFEALTENYLVPGGKPLYYLEQVRSRYPVVLHGVSLSIGSTDPLNRGYLSQLKALAERIEPAWISDHLCWTGVKGRNLHDLLPLPYTEEAMVHVSDRIRTVQDYLGCRLLIENVSSYLTYADSCMSEWEFLSAVAARADCLILLDINNVYVSSFNHDFDPHAYLQGVPAERVQQFHIAGHRNHGDYLVDTHDEPVIEPVWQLYAEACRRFGAVSTLIERDDNIPPLAELLVELERARRIAAGVATQSPERAGTA
jgi:uncharacterized protein (UPF0276 family)